MNQNTINNATNFAGRLKARRQALEGVKVAGAFGQGVKERAVALLEEVTEEVYGLLRDMRDPDAAERRAAVDLERVEAGRALEEAKRLDLEGTADPEEAIARHHAYVVALARHRAAKAAAEAPSEASAPAVRFVVLERRWSRAETAAEEATEAIYRDWSREVPMYDRGEGLITQHVGQVGLSLDTVAHWLLAEPDALRRAEDFAKRVAEELPERDPRRQACTVERLAAVFDHRRAAAEARLT